MDLSLSSAHTPTDIRSYRRRMGLKQDALATMLGVDQATISRWERGRSPIDPDVLGKLRDSSLTSRPFFNADLDNVWPALLRFYRSARGISQEQLADRLNCSAYSVSRWECGKFKPDLGAQMRLRDLILSPLENDRQVGRLIDRIESSPSRCNINWGPITLAWSRQLKHMNAQLGRNISMLTDVTELHEGKYQEWWSNACKAGFSRGEVPFAYGFWRFSETDTRKIYAIPAGTVEGTAVWVTYHLRCNIDALGRSDGEVIIKHADELIG
ncbi:MAG: helix-turn-helix domain-containing protein [Alphaproteobacteria bacterium]|nr:helix-turn-helix domain-containing protein [Alphaproteobacteria bacterium]